MSGQVNVGIEAPPQVDLAKVMEEIREHYESITAKNRKELDEWHRSQVSHAAS